MEDRQRGTGAHTLHGYMQPPALPRITSPTSVAHAQRAPASASFYAQANQSVHASLRCSCKYYVAVCRHSQLPERPGCSQRGNAGKLSPCLFAQAELPTGSLEDPGGMGWETYVLEPPAPPPSFRVALRPAVSVALSRARGFLTQRYALNALCCTWLEGSEAACGWGADSCLARLAFCPFRRSALTVSGGQSLSRLTGTIAAR
jgi:hypothetical protein